jgi:hypothetical protein
MTGLPVDKFLSAQGIGAEIPEAAAAERRRLRNWSG